MRKRVSYVLVGFGGIAESRVAREGFACDCARFRPLPTARLVGATDQNPARRQAAEALGLRWYESLDAVLADSSVDAVYIATNNASHAALAIAALKAGKHVIVEKPMATRKADARKMDCLAKARGLSLTVDHMMVNNAWTQLAKKIVDKGILGAVNDACFHMEFAYGYDSAEAATWRCSKVEELGGPVGDVASHCFYVAEYLLGKRIARLAAVYYPKTMKIRSEDGAYIKMFFMDGTQGSVRAAFSEKRGGLSGTLTNLGYEVYGDQAVLRGYGTMFQLSGHSDEPVRMRLEVDDGKSLHPLFPSRVQNIYQKVIEQHAQSVIRKCPLTGDDAIHNLELVAAVHASARAGGRIMRIGK